MGLTAFKVLPTKKNESSTVAKVGRYVPQSGDFKTECPFCGRDVRAIRDRNTGIFLLTQNCRCMYTQDDYRTSDPNAKHLGNGHCTAVFTREMYQTRFGTDEVFESFVPVIFIFRNYRTLEKASRLDNLDIAIHRLNYFSAGKAVFSLEVKRGRRSILWRTDRDGQIRVASEPSYRAMFDFLEDLIEGEVHPQTPAAELASRRMLRQKSEAKKAKSLG